MNKGRLTLTRRQVLGRMSLAIGAVVGTQLLAACGASAPSPAAQPQSTSAPSASQPKPTTASAPAQQPAATSAPVAAKAAGSITMMVQAGAPQTQAFKAFAPEFGKSTGIEVKLVEVPTGEMFPKLMVELSTGTSSYDLVTLNNTALWGAAQYLEDAEALGLLTPDLKTDLAPAILTQAQDLNGVFRGLPHFVTCPGLYCRTDLLSAKGLNPPATWDEWLAAAQKLNDPANNVWGTVIQASAKTSGGGSKVAEWFYQNGGSIADDRGKPTINMPENAEALKFIAALVTEHKVAPPDAADITHVEINNLFNQGRAALVLNPQYMANMSRDAQQSKVSDKFTVNAYPGNKRKGVMLGGWYLSVPTAAKNKEAAVAFAKACLTPDEQIRLTTQEGICARISVMDTSKYPKIKEANPFIDVFGKMIAEIGISPPKWVKIDDIYRRITVANQQIISKQRTAEEALAEAQKEVVDLVG